MQFLKKIFYSLMRFEVGLLTRVIFLRELDPLSSKEELAAWDELRHCWVCQVSPGCLASSLDL